MVGEAGGTRIGKLLIDPGQERHWDEMRVATKEFIEDLKEFPRNGIQEKHIYYSCHA